MLFEIEKCKVFFIIYFQLFAIIGTNILWIFLWIPIHVLGTY